MFFPSTVNDSVVRPKSQANAPAAEPMNIASM